MSRVTWAILLASAFLFVSGPMKAQSLEPTLVTMSISPNAIHPGECVHFWWELSPGTHQVGLWRWENEGPWVAVAQATVNGQATDCPQDVRTGGRLVYTAKSQRSDAVWEDQSWTITVLEASIATNTPTPTMTPTPHVVVTSTPTQMPTVVAVPSATEISLQAEVREAGSVEAHVVSTVCQYNYLAAVGQGNVVAAEEQEVSVRWRSPIEANPTCMKPQTVAMNTCPNPRRTDMVKDDRGNGWSYVIDCGNGFNHQQPVTFGTVQQWSGGTTSMNPIGGIVVVAAALASSTAVEEYVWRPASQGALQLGEATASNVQQMMNWLQVSSPFPGTWGAPEPTAIWVGVENGEEDSIVRFYREPTVALETEVWAIADPHYAQNEHVVAQVEFLIVDPYGLFGSEVKVQSIYFVDARPESGYFDERGKDLRVKMPEEMAGMYDTPPLVDGAPALCGVHGCNNGGAADTPAAVAKKITAWNKAVNMVLTHVRMGQRPPWDWCGVAGKRCICTCYSASCVIVKLAEKLLGKGPKHWLTEGIALLLNGDVPTQSTAWSGVLPAVPNAPRWSSGLKPTKAVYEPFETVNPNNPSDYDKIANSCGGMGLQPAQ